MKNADNEGERKANCVEEKCLMPALYVFVPVMPWLLTSAAAETFVCVYVYLKFSF